MAQFAGVNAAAVTPRGKQGEIDFGLAFELIDLLCRAGVAGIALFDTAGEYPAFHREERSRLVYLAAKRSRVPLMVGVGAATLEDSVALAREARDSGAEALLLPPPFFFPHSQQEIRDFYLSFAAQTGEPGDVFLRHPAGAGVNAITSETARELIDSAGFAGIADAGKDCLELARTCTLLAGDASWVRAQRDGAAGAILESACAIPELAVALSQALTRGDLPEVARLEGLYREFLAWTRRLPPLVAIKAALGVRGVRIPFAIPNKDLDAFREWFRGWMRCLGKSSAHA
jgi:dihydrodipicolinate synthase/N-acetylneuraminate lyase